MSSDFQIFMIGTESILQRFSQIDGVALPDQFAGFVESHLVGKQRTRPASRAAY